MVLKRILIVSMCFKAFCLQWLLDTLIRSCGLGSKPVDTIFPEEFNEVYVTLCQPFPAAYFKLLCLTDTFAVT